MSYFLLRSISLGFCGTTLVLLIVGSNLISTAFAAETGNLLKMDTLRSKPFSDAPISATLARGEAVTILSAQSGWIEVITAKKQRGWLRILSIKRNVAKTQDAKGLLALNSGRGGTGKILATTGVRGLSVDELKGAKYSEAQMTLLGTFQVEALAARQIAQQKGLVEITFTELAAPTKNTK